jgi:hypothetical protein
MIVTYFKVLSRRSPGGNEENLENPFIMPEIRTRYLQKISQERYRYSILLDTI